MPRVATRAVLQKNLKAKMMAASDFSFGSWNFQQPSKFGQFLNNRDQAGGLWCHFTSSMPKAATRALLSKEFEGNKMATSDCSFIA
jgi:hypothetical protein